MNLMGVTYFYPELLITSAELQYPWRFKLFAELLSWLEEKANGEMIFFLENSRMVGRVNYLRDCRAIESIRP